MKYSVDTSAILDGRVRHYPPDVFPALWTRFDELIHDGQLGAVEEVLVELERKDDETYAWASQRASMFVPIDDEIQRAVAEILSNHPRLVDTRKNRSGADPFVIALAKVNGCLVVTGERPTNSVDRPNIPDVCSALGIRSLSLLELIREEQWAF